jgi:hypothetical protein
MTHQFSNSCRPHTDPQRAAFHNANEMQIPAELLQRKKNDSILLNEGRKLSHDAVGPGRVIFIN